MRLALIRGPLFLTTDEPGYLPAYPPRILRTIDQFRSLSEIEFPQPSVVMGWRSDHEMLGSKWPKTVHSDRLSG